MKNKITLTLLLFGLITGSNNLFSQNPSLTWAYGLSVTPTNGQLDIASLITDASGNTYALCIISGTVDFDLGAGVTNLSSLAGKSSIVTAKYDPTGALLWARGINLNESMLQSPKFDIDANGNGVICGSFGGTIDLDPNAGTANITATAGGQTDIFAVKWTSNGNYVWGFKVGTTAADQFSCIAVDPIGDVFLSGRVINTSIDLDPSAAVANVTGNPSSAFLAKYSSSGAFIWGKNIGVSDAIEMTTNATGDVFLTGSFSGTVDADPSAGTANLVSGGNADIYMAKYSGAGNYIWAKSLDGSNTDYAGSITLDPQGNVLLGFTFEGTIDLDPSAGIANVAATYLNSDGALAKYDPVGNYLWGGSIGSATGASDFISDIRTDAASNVYISGRYAGTVDFDITSGVHNGTAAGYNSYFAKYTSSGNLVWANEFEYCDATSLTVNGSGTEIIFTGNHLGSVDMDYSAGVYEVTGTGSNSAFLAKYAGGNCTNTASSISITECSSYTVPSGDETHTVSGIYMDTIPNAANCDSIITINLTIGDAVAPLANTPTLANATGQCSVTTLTAPTATDNCAGTITGTHNATLPITAQGTTLVTWTYNDGNGNTSTQTQNVIITDNTAPVANTANLSNVTGQCSVASLTAPTAIDNCAGTITGTHSTTLPITTPGTTIITWTYADGNGNTSTQTQNVIVTLPVATTTLNGITISATTSGATYQWINCGTGNTPIAGATSQSFTATVNGSYAVIVTQNGCSVTSACVTISTVGLEDLTTSLFTLYPNPNTGTFKVVTELQVNIQITNAAGQLVSKQTVEPGESIIELVDAESGIYFLAATDSNGQPTVQRVNIIK